MPAMPPLLLDMSSAHDLPLYARLRRAVREAVDKGQLLPGQALPAERVMAEELGISRLTVRKAIEGLVSDGLLVNRRGAGNFISGRIDQNVARLSSFSEDMRARGRSARSIWLKRSEGRATPEEALHLRLPAGDPVYRFHRLRYADDVPMCIEYATVDASCLPRPEAVDASIYEALERVNARPVRATQRLSAMLLDADQAELLQARPGEACFAVQRLAFARDGRAVEFCHSYFRGDLYHFFAELNGL